MRYCGCPCRRRWEIQLIYGGIRDIRVGLRDACRGSGEISRNYLLEGERDVSNGLCHIEEGHRDLEDGLRRLGFDDCRREYRRIKEGLNDIREGEKEICDGLDDLHCLRKCKSVEEINKGIHDVEEGLRDITRTLRCMM